ncbi:hypothetical protein F4779DRAFT_620542 [Xylariaceae sp. FL0662B]|nr:hypothetical protein F4779DRAFT_620542 [Xylariaceae sp. FL0662B]
MQFYTFTLVILTSLAAMSSSLPISAGDAGAVNHSKRLPCPAASEAAPSEEYKRDMVPVENEDELGDDTPGNIVACAF